MRRLSWAGSGARRVVDRARIGGREVCARPGRVHRRRERPGQVGETLSDQSRHTATAGERAVRAPIGAAVAGTLRSLRVRVGGRGAAIVPLGRHLTRRGLGDREERRRRKHVHHEHERSEHETKHYRHRVPFRSAPRPRNEPGVTNSRPIDGKAQVLKNVGRLEHCPRRSRTEAGTLASMSPIPSATATVRHVCRRSPPQWLRTDRSSLCSAM